MWWDHSGRSGLSGPSEMSLGFERNSGGARPDSGFVEVVWPVAAAGVLDSCPAGLIGWSVAG